MESWIKENSKREKYVKQLYMIWKESEKPPTQLNVDEALKALSGKMDRDLAQLRQVASGKQKVKYIHANGYQDKKIKRYGAGLRRLALTAASVAIIFTAGIFSYNVHTGSNTTTTAETVIRVYEAQDGERAIYKLGDGTRVILHAGSRIEVPDNYNVENRELSLKGEAYFEAVHNPDKPFIVHSQDTYTRVIGTRFLVKAWPDEERKVEVVVSEGKVLFGDERTATDGHRNETHIVQNQMAVIMGDSAPILQEVGDLNWYLGWIDGRLVFENQPLHEIFQRLEQWYDVKIYISDENIAEMKLTAEINYSLTMTNVMNGVALSLDLEVHREGRTFTFRK